MAGEWEDLRDVVSLAASSRNSISGALDRALLARAARYIARHLDWFDLSEADDPAGYRLARQLAESAGIKQEIAEKLDAAKARLASGQG